MHRECDIKCREFTDAGLTLSVVLGCSQSAGDRADTVSSSGCLDDLDSEGTTCLGFWSPVF